MSAVVLVHGAVGNAATWALEPWGPGAVAVDLPGRGATPGPARDRVEDAAMWLAGWLRARGGPPPVVVGHSYGGAIALQLALDHRDAVGAIALVSSAARLKVHPLIVAAAEAATVDAPYRLDAAFGRGTPVAVIDAYAVHTAATPPASALADWRACDAFDVRDRLHEIATPTLVVHGDNDDLAPARFQGRLADAIPGARRVELAGYGHMLPWEAPRALADAVRSWVSAATPPG